uniref:Ovule protein n=1 Tax=Romanomermis culicivorax TaxID=13658 RepID=A0A915KMA0_ROMCU
GDFSEALKRVLFIVKRNLILSTRKQSLIQRYYFVIILSYSVPLYIVLVDCEPSHTIFQDQ